MKVLIAAAFALLLTAACASAPGTADRWLFHGAFTDAHRRGVNERLYRADVQACGRGPGAAWCRQAADDANLSRLDPAGGWTTTPGITGTDPYAYDASQCAGDMQGGLCRGAVRPRIASSPVCHGQIIDGVCSGPVF